MTSGGGDKQRAGFTTRVVAITETDGMDNAGETSREADAVEQIEARTLAYGRRDKRVYLECTVSVERGRIWQEVTRGTDTRIYRPCPHCGEYVSPDRADLHGWREVESAENAADMAHWQCPVCHATWTDTERREGWRDAVLVHRGQQALPSGEVVGDPPRTQTFGLRWSAVDNPFTTAADLGAEEWKAARDHDRENAEKKPVLTVKVQQEVRVMIPCADCGTDLKETTLSFEMEAEHRCDKLPSEEKEGIEIEGEIEAEPIDDFRTTDRKGKPIKNPRYQAHLYGAEVTARATCPFCQEQIEFSGSDNGRVFFDG